MTNSGVSYSGDDEWWSKMLGYEIFALNLFSFSFLFSFFKFINLFYFSSILFFLCSSYLLLFCVFPVREEGGELERMMNSEMWIFGLRFLGIFSDWEWVMFSVLVLWAKMMREPLMNARFSIYRCWWFNWFYYPISLGFVIYVMLWISSYKISWN